jgi:predicted MFS family arabinose efflux permease
MDAAVAIQEKKFTGYQVLAIILLALTQFTVVLDFMVMSPLGDMLIKSMGLTTSQFGFAVSAYAFSAGFSGLLTAGFADRFDRKKLLLFFYIGFIAGTLFCGLSHTYYMLLAARIITGVFGGVIGSISMAIMADLFPLHQRGRAMGFIQMGFGASQVLGIPISLYIANHWGWQSPFIMIVGLSGLIWLITLLKLHPVTKHLHLKNDKTAVLHLWHTIKQPHYRTGFLMTALLSLGGFMMMPWGSAFAVNNLHVSYGQLPILFMTSGIAALIIMPLVGKLSDKIDKVKLFTIAAIWMMVIVVIYTNLGPVAFPIVMMMNILMMIGIMSRIVPAMALVTALPKMQDRGAFMSINSSLQQIAGGIAAGVGGLIVVQKTKTSPLQHYNTLGYVIVVIIIANIIQIYRVNNLIKAQKHIDKL